MADLDKVLKYRDIMLTTRIGTESHDFSHCNIWLKAGPSGKLNKGKNIVIEKGN